MTAFPPAGHSYPPTHLNHDRFRGESHSIGHRSTEVCCAEDPPRRLLRQSTLLDLWFVVFSVHGDSDIASQGFSVLWIL